MKYETKGNWTYQLVISSLQIYNIKKSTDACVYLCADDKQERKKGKTFRRIYTFNKLQ